MDSIAEVFDCASDCHQAGDFKRAEQLYRQILNHNPNHADSHHALGVLAYQAGCFDFALESIGRAVGLNPSAANYYCNLGLAYAALGHAAHAIQCYQNALRLEADFAEAHSNLANVLQGVGRLEEAEFHCRQALHFRPAFAEAYNNLANVLSKLARHDEAEGGFRQALQLRPEFAEAHNNLANTLQAKGQLDEAVIHLQAALRLRPDMQVAHNNLANVLIKQGKANEALAHCEEALRRYPQSPEAHYHLGTLLHAHGQSDRALFHMGQALRLRPEFAEAHNNLANIYYDLGRLAEAQAHYRESLRLEPGTLEPWCNLGLILGELCQFDEAVACYQRALQMHPGHGQIHNDLGHVLLTMGRADLALEHFRQARDSRPDWQLAQSNYLQCLNYDPHVDADTVFAEHRRWAALQTSAGSWAAHANNRDPQRRLRIGYVSPDFRRHALARYFEPVLRHHDPDQVEVYCYADVRKSDEVTAHYQTLAHVWRNIRGLPDVDAAKQIRADVIDILVDLAGHTGGSRLGVFALKPAPVQATWLGYLNTTGLSAVDFRITDDVLDPPGQTVRDTEQLFRLAHGFCCFEPPADAPEVGPLPALERGHLTFGSLHSLFKLNSKVFDVWGQILHAIPTARLLIFRETLVGRALENVLDQFAQRGIESSRLDLRLGSCAPGYLSICREIDVGLDAFPWTGGVITCELLWMGVPVLTLSGLRPAGRNSASILSRLGLHEWIAATPQDYVAKAVSLTTKTAQLAELRTMLRERTAKALGDGKRFTQTLEQAYRTMWFRWCSDPGLKE